MKPIRAYHFFGGTLRDGTPVPHDGVVLEATARPLELCRYGLHASIHPFDALKFAPGPNLAIVELSGTIIRGDDKLCASRRIIIQRIDATNLLRQFARECALDVIHLWDAPEVVVRYLETGDESIREAAARAARAARYAAWDAAWDAAWGARDAARYATRDAAWDATRDAAWDAARDAAWDAWDAVRDAWDAVRDAATRDVARATQRERFQALVDEAFTREES